jgi:hypothetical protein
MPIRQSAANPNRLLHTTNSSQASRLFSLSSPFSSSHKHPQLSITAATSTFTSATLV